MNQKIKAVLGFLVSGAVLTAIDQWTKSLAVAGLKGKEPFVIWKDVFELLYSENRGAAFGVLQGKHGFFFLVAACVFVAALYVTWKLPNEKKFVPLRICVTLITAGAAGNRGRSDQMRTVLCQREMARRHADQPQDDCKENPETQRHSQNGRGRHV